MYYTMLDNSNNCLLKILCFLNPTNEIFDNSNEIFYLTYHSCQIYSSFLGLVVITVEITISG